VTGYLWSEIQGTNDVILESNNLEGEEPNTGSIIRVKFLEAIEGGNRVTLEVTNKNGTCSVTKNIPLTFGLPEWEEVKPD
jgi:hypothetical protein